MVADSGSPTLTREALVDAVKQMNAWHANTPLLFVFSKQRPGKKGNVSGNVEAVRSAYDALFNLDHIGVADDARSFYLHFCHKKGGGQPYAIKKPTENYGKTHQRIIKDTFANPEGFLERVGEGKYRLRDDFVDRVRRYFKAETIDLKPLVLYLYWNRANGSQTIGDLWKKLAADFGLTTPPFDEVFTCSGLAEKIPFRAVGAPAPDMKTICLPNIYGSEQYDVDFWARFNAAMEARFKELKWQGKTSGLAAAITTALMHDEAVFLLGPPGTGKTTIVRDVVLPSLRSAIGEANALAFHPFNVTQQTTHADLFGFQGLDGTWIMGPLGRSLLIPYSAPPSADDEEAGAEAAAEEAPSEASPTPEKTPHLVFLDEANRTDVEALLSPVQGNLDRLQARKEPGVVALGGSEFTLPRKVWRIFAGNSPRADLGRKQQSRPFKRRLSAVVPPDPMNEALSTEPRFKAMCTELLDRAQRSDSPEVAVPAMGLYGALHANPEPLSALRDVLAVVKTLPQVALSVGLVESVLLRAAAHNALGRTNPLDAALKQSLLALLAGDASRVAGLLDEEMVKSFPEFTAAVKAELLGADAADQGPDVDPVL